MVVAAAPDHRFATTPCESLGALAGERWLAFPWLPGRPESAAASVRRALEIIGVDEDRIRWIDSLTAQKRLVEAGFGVALVPESSIGEEVAAGTLTVLDVPDLDVTQPVTVVTRRNGYLGASALTLLDELRAAAWSGRSRSASTAEIKQPTPR